jgi:prepilin-type N-terminal cleavage/methylation domain-containing protein
MQTFRAQQGFTLIELMTVVAVAGFLAVWGIASLRSYARHEDTRKAATAMAGVFSQARAEAVAGGRMTFVLLAEPSDGSVPAFVPGQYGAYVIDQNGDGKIDAGDAVTPLFLPPGLSPDVTIYGAEGLNALQTATIPGIDESQAVTGGNMTALVDGTTIPVDPTANVPVVAFAPQGAPVTPAAPTNWGAGSGGVYVTDNDKMLIAVVVQPLGDVKTLLWDQGAGQWK